MSRRRSMTGEYHIIPQTPVVSHSVLLSPEEAEQYDDRDEDDVPSPVSPVDTSIEHTVWWAYFTLGAVMLLAWNVIINSIPYFLKRLEGSAIHSTFSFWLTTSSTLFNFVVLWYATVTSAQQSATTRILTAISSAAILMFFLLLSTLIYVPPTLLGVFVLLDTVLQASAAAFLQTAVMALASLFGSQAIQAVLSGQAAIGVAVSVVEFFSTVFSTRRAQRMNAAPPWRGPRSEDRGATAFFGLAMLFMLLSLMAHGYIMRTKQYKAIRAARRRVGLQQSWMSGMTDESSPLIASEMDMTASRSSFGLREPPGGRTVSEMLVLNKTYNLSVAFVYLVTLSVFPPITTMITSVNPSSPNILTTPLVFQALHFVLFNVGDLAGRFLPNFPGLFVSSPRKLACLSLGRVLFIPLFSMCNITISSLAATRPAPVINSDIVFFLLVLLLGLTNGFISCNLMICAPSLEHNPKLENKRVDVDTAATVMSFSLVLGLVVGCFASFGVRELVLLVRHVR